MYWFDPRIAVTFAVALLFAATDLFWIRSSNVLIDGSTWVAIGKSALLLLVAGLATRIVRFRLAADESPIARIIKRLAISTDVARQTAIVMACLTVPSITFMYLASATATPLQDQTLAAVDELFRFDWRYFHALMNRPIVSTVLVWSYHFIGPQLLMVYALHAAFGDADKAIELNTLTAVSSVFVGWGMVFWPAAGAYSLYQTEPGYFTAAAGMWHYHELELLRSGEPFPLAIERAQGLTTFPSFHSALGIIVTYSLREWRRIFYVAVLINTLMIISTIPEGGHYLIDVVAGIAIGVVAVAIVRMIEKYGSRWQRAWPQA